MSAGQQKDYDFTFTLDGRIFLINEEATIGELDEAVMRINRKLINMTADRRELEQTLHRLYQFMKQHQTFDLYIDECRKAAKK